MVAVLVEAVGIQALGALGNPESGFTGEHLVAQALRGDAMLSIGGHHQGVL
jgi:hypothetical protein